MGPGHRQALTLLATLSTLLVLLAVPAAPAGAAPPGATASRASCSTAAAARAVRHSGFAARAERYWAKRFGKAEFSVWKSVCGQLAGHGRDMVVMLLLESGTGGSPRPWAIFNRTRRGRLHLRHADLGRHLICPQGVGIHNHTLTIYRPSEYLGAFTLCDRVVHYRWQRKHYVLTGVRNAYTTCRSPLVAAPPGPGWGLIFERLRVAAASCPTALHVAARDIYGGSTGRWDCTEVFGGEHRCAYAGNWRKWLTYFFGGDAG